MCIIREKFAMVRAPSPAREARALPDPLRLYLRQLIGLSFTFSLAGCELTNYAPEVAPRTASVRSASTQAVHLTRLQRGRILFVHRCIECHTLPPLWHYSTEDWPGIVSSMSHRAGLKPLERDAILSYILAVRKQM